MTEAAVLGRQRVTARLDAEVALQGGRTRPVRASETGGLRLRWPAAFGSELGGVILNTGGGVACGDRLELAVTVGAGACLALSTPGAERIYRSDGAVADIATRLAVGPGASLAWLPQETILYDAARLSRSLSVDVAPDARLLACEILVFGREAFGEAVQSGSLRDRWQIRRGGRLVYADTLLLSGAIAESLARPAIAGGARALATLLYVAPDAESRLDEARVLLEDAACACGASAWNGLLAVRFLAASSAALKQTAARFMQGFRGRAMPRVWYS